MAEIIRDHAAAGLLAGRRSAVDCAAAQQLQATAADYSTQDVEVPYGTLPDTDASMTAAAALPSKLLAAASGPGQMWMSWPGLRRVHILAAGRSQGVEYVLPPHTPQQGERGDTST